MAILVNSDASQRPSADQLGDYLSGLGASSGERLMLTGAATSESQRDPGATHDNGIGYGMFGHNGSRLMAMRQYASSNGQDIGDWRTQAGFALNELRSRPEGKFAAEATTPEQSTLAQMYYERPAGFTEQNPEAGMNYAGRLDTIRSLASGKSPSLATAGVSSSPAPADAPNSGASATGQGGLPPSGSGSAPSLMGVSNVRNPALLSMVQRMSAGPSDDGYQPLVGFLANKAAATLLPGVVTDPTVLAQQAAAQRQKQQQGQNGGSQQQPQDPNAGFQPLASVAANKLLAPLGALFGGAPPSASGPSLSPISLPLPAPAAAQAQPSPVSGVNGASPSLPFFAAGPPPASPIADPTLGPSSAAPTMTSSFGAGLANLFGVGGQA